ncbi:MAG: hypothetical protein GC178_06095 [Flavobacteriales bacterium]|nr:hypothetical protein [Flavobacteriales bacterium]
MVSNTNISVLQKLNVETLSRLKDMLVEVDQRLYTHVNHKGRASVGQHVRHTLEFYQCLFEATDTVNYDQRKRDILIESSAAHAVHVADQILKSVSQIKADRPMQLEAEMLGAAQPLCVRSSLSRELLYVLEHAIHHMALMRILIKDEAADFELEDAFGVAYSTLAYRGEQND